MRYSFQDFLNYQNELNDKYCQETVDAMIDSILDELQRTIDENPTTHIALIHHYYTTNSYVEYFYQSSLKQLEAVKEYFENMGFTVEYHRYNRTNSSFNNSTDGIKGFMLTW